LESKFEILRGDARNANPPVLSARCSKLIGRAQLANLLADRTLRPSDPLPFPEADAVACELAREAIYWALFAQRELAPTSAPGPTQAMSAPPDKIALATLWAEAAPELLDRAAEGLGQVERLRVELVDKSFADFAELSPEQQAATAARLHTFAERLIEPLVAPQRAQERLWVRRVQWLLAALAVLIVLGLFAKSWKDKHDLTHDLAASASWTTSSQHDECSCPSPAQSCAACPNFFFHTLADKQPWIVFDLHQVQTLSAVVVENRRDCCGERAVPLVVQVSADRKHWKTVATRKDEFDTWRADFPTEQARWVKLYVSRSDYLHLARVRLLP
jgi:hypothetical protein